MNEIDVVRAEDTESRNYRSTLSPTRYVPWESVERVPISSSALEYISGV